MSATASYDGRAFAAAFYEAHPERATLDLLDAEDRAIARLARERFEDRYQVRSPDVYWRLSANVRRSYLDDAVLELHPNPKRTP